MKNSRIKIAAIILAFCLCMTSMAGVLSIQKSSDYLVAEIDDKLQRSAEKNAYEVSAHLNHMVGLVDSILANAETELSEDMLNSSKSEIYVRAFIESQEEYIRNCLETSNNAHSLYLVMAPDLTESPVEVWFQSDNKGMVTQLYVDPAKKKKDLNNEDLDSMAYYFKARDNKGEGVWTGLYYDDDVNENLFSYSRAVYIGDRFVGVAGSDIVADDTKKLMEELKLYENSNAAIFDSDYGYVITPDTEKEQTDALAKALKENRIGTSGVFSYEASGERFVTGYAAMENGWIVATTQPQDEVYMSLESTGIVLTGVALLLGVLLLIFLIGFSMYFVKREDALEQENMEKDILLAYQFRRSSVGEMVGNVAHQWKQPLNTINLILANLADSYKFGELDEKTLKTSVNKIENITDKMASTISDFSGFLKPSDDKMSEYNVRECVEGAISLMEENLAQKKVLITQEYTGDMTAWGYGNELQHVIFNILDNARDAVVAARTTGRQIDIDAGCYGDIIRIRINDNGTGMPSYVASNAFEPYFTTKDKEGTGLGLYICRNIIKKRMKGTIAIENTSSGARCTVTIPKKLSSRQKSENL